MSQETSSTRDGHQSDVPFPSSCSLSDFDLSYENVTKTTRKKATECCLGFQFLYRDTLTMATLTKKNLTEVVAYSF